MDDYFNKYVNYHYGKKGRIGVLKDSYRELKGKITRPFKSLNNTFKLLKSSSRKIIFLLKEWF